MCCHMTDACLVNNNMNVYSAEGFLRTVCHKLLTLPKQSLVKVYSYHGGRKYTEPRQAQIRYMLV